MRANNEGSVYQRKDGYWVAAVTMLKHGKRKQISRYAKTEEEARRLLTDLKHRQDKYEPIHFDRQTVGEYLQWWLDAFVKPPKRKPRTWASYHHALHKYVLPEIGREPLAGLAPERILDILNHHSDRGRLRTAAYIRTVLRIAFKRAVKLKRMPWNPVDALDTVTVPEAEMKTYTAEQAEAFLRAAEKHRLEGLFWLALGLGLRKGELCALSLPECGLSKRHDPGSGNLTACQAPRFLHAQGVSPFTIQEILGHSQLPPLFRGDPSSCG